MRRVVAFFCILIITVFGYFLSGSVAKVFSQTTTSSGIAVDLPINDNDVRVGDIISVTGQGYVLSKTAYDANIFGVVVDEPAIAFENRQAGYYPIVYAGKVFMRVSAQNGEIRRGDLITSSSTPGVGQKATESGFIAGTALADYKSDTPGTILVVLNVGHGNVSAEESGSLLRAFNFVLNAPYLSPIAVLRYVISGIIILVSFILAIAYFGRLSSLGIEALGRNPLAGRMILLGILANVLIALSIIGVGLMIGYFVLVI